MSVVFFIVERFSEILTIALHIYFLYRVMEAKLSITKQIWFGFAFTCMRMFYFVLALEYRPYFAVIIGIVYASVVFGGDLKTHTIWTIILIVFDGIVDAIVINIYLLFPNTDTLHISKPGTIRIMAIIIAKLILFAVYYLTTRKVDKTHIIQWNESPALCITPVGCWILLEIIFQNSDAMQNEIPAPLLAAGSIVLLLILSSIVTLYNQLTLHGKELAQSKLQLHTIQSTQEHIVQIEELYIKLASIQHDLQNHFAAISGYLETEEYSVLERYMSELTDTEIDILEYTKHPVLNALISAKMKIARSKNIDFTSEIVLPESPPISDVDLCILVSNMLDNAFEANDTVTDTRFIRLYARMSDAYWVIACRNATCEASCFKVVGSLASTKSIAGVHGIGTKQIQRIAEKTGGFVTFQRHNYEFFTMAMIKMPE